MPNKELKCAVLAAIVSSILIWIYQFGDLFEIVLAPLSILCMGLISFDKRLAVYGDGDDIPGLLPIFSLLSFLVMIIASQVLPPARGGFGFYVHRNISNNVLADIVLGSLLALSIWVPIGSYALIDYLVGRRAHRNLG